MQSVVGATGGMSVVVTPSYYNVTGSGVTTTASFTAHPTGGTPAYTYAWSQVSGDSSIVINTPAVASTSFSYTLVAADYVVGTFACKVTDSHSLMATSNTVTVTFQGIF
jgi:hypothetical protein